MEKKTIRRILITLFAMIFLGSAGYSAKVFLDYRNDRRMYDAAREEFIISSAPSDVTADLDKKSPVTASQEEEGKTDKKEKTEFSGISVDFNALKAINSDILGWIWIPDTDISYPLLQGKSNQSYIATSYTGVHAGAGSIFMDFRNASDFSDSNTIIYGHNMNDGTMFGTLKKYRKAEYWSTHPYFYIVKPDGQSKYEICFVTVTDSLSDVYNRSFTGEEAYEAHIAMLDKASLYDTGVGVGAEEHIVTLSTCTGGKKTERFVVVGRLVADTADK